jgi:PAS domain S-box-containing protein
LSAQSRCGMTSPSVCKLKRRCARASSGWLSLWTASLTGFYAIDRQWRFTHINDAATRHFGQARELMLGRTIHEVFPRFPGSVFEAEFRRAWQVGDPVHIQAPSVVVDRIVELFVYPGAETLTVLFRDVTDRIRTEQLLCQSEERLRLAQSAADVGIWAWDLDSRTLDLTPELEALYGLEPGTIKSYEDWIRLVHPEDAPRMEVERDKSIAQQRPFEMEFRIQHTSGETRWIHARGGATYDDAGRATRVFGINIDISSRKQLEEELRESREDLNRAQAVAQTGSWRLNVQRNELLWSEENHRIFGIPQGKPLTYETFLGVVHPDDRQYVHENWSAGLRGEPYDIEHRLVVGDTVKWVREKAELEFDKEGALLGGFGTTQDITERKRAEHDLIESEARFRVLSETASRLLSSPDPQAIVHELCKQVMVHLDCQAFFNFLVDEHAGRLHLNACDGIPDEEVRKIEWLDYGVAVCGCVARDRVRIVAEDICNVPDLRTDLVKSYGIKAYACHPLMAEERVIGTLSFGTKTRTHFSPQDLAFMKTVTDQVAVAMERKRLMEELQRSRDELEMRVRDRTEELAEANRILETSEMRLLKNYELLQKVLDGITDPLIMLDREGLLRMMNKAAMDYYRVAQISDVLGKPCYRGLRVRESPCPECDYPFLSVVSETATFERKGLHDPRRTENVILYPLLDRSGQRDDLIIRISDVTEAKLLERQILQNEKLASLGLLTSGIAHEINNPNSFIYFNIPILKKYLQELMPILDEHAALHPDFEVLHMSYRDLREDIFKLLENMEHGSQRINNIVGVLKSFVRKRDSAGMQKVDLRQLIGKVVALCHAEMKRTIKSFELLIPANLPPLITDAEALEQVLLNLLINAIHACDKLDSRVSLKVEQDISGRDGLIIEITDNGAGIEETIRDRIFDPFFTTKPSPLGTGLGLYICHNHVESLGGNIEVKSSVGQGSTFRVLLPQMDKK